MAAIALRNFPLACMLDGFESIYRAGGERIYMPTCICSRLRIRRANAHRLNRTRGRRWQILTSSHAQHNAANQRKLSVVQYLPKQLKKQQTYGCVCWVNLGSRVLPVIVCKVTQFKTRYNFLGWVCAVIGLNILNEGFQNDSFYRVGVKNKLVKLIQFSLTKLSLKKLMVVTTLTSETIFDGLLN